MHHTENWQVTLEMVTGAYTRHLDAIFRNLAKLVVILPRTGLPWRDLATGYFSRRDILKSRRDRGYLTVLGATSARLPQSCWDRSKIFTRDCFFQRGHYFQNFILTNINDSHDNTDFNKDIILRDVFTKLLQRNLGLNNNSVLSPFLYRCQNYNCYIKTRTVINFIGKVLL